MEPFLPHVVNTQSDF